MRQLVVDPLVHGRAHRRPPSTGRKFGHVDRSATARLPACSSFLLLVAASCLARIQDERRRLFLPHRHQVVNFANRQVRLETKRVLMPEKLHRDAGVLGLSLDTPAPVGDNTTVCLASFVLDTAATEPLTPVVTYFTPNMPKSPHA